MPPSLRLVEQERTAYKSDRARSSSPHSFSSNSIAPATVPTLKIPRKRPTASPISDVGGSPSLTNGTASRPSSTSSLDGSSVRQSRQLADIRVAHQETVFPKANVIEPELLLSYLTQGPESTQPSILLLDVRPKEIYERGCLNAPNVVWIDPILLDEE